MIFAKLKDSSLVAHDYYDIWDVSVDAKSCVGVGFMSLEARQAEFCLLVDTWVRDNIVEGVAAGKGYLPVSCEIYDGSTLLIKGWVMQDSETEEPVPGVEVCRVKLGDALCMLLDFGEGMKKSLAYNSVIYPLAEIGNTLAAMRAALPSTLYPAFPLSLDPDYEVLDWMPYFAPGAEILNWEDLPAPTYNNVIDRYFVIYINGGNELIIEYCLYDTFTFTYGATPPYGIDYYQHLWWKKWKLEGESLTEVSASGNQTDLDSGGIANLDPETIAAYIATVTSLKAGYSITAPNGIEQIRSGYMGCMLADSRVLLLLHPSEGAMTQETEGEETSFEVDNNGFLSDMVKLMCAYLEVDGSEINIKNKLLLPADPSYEVLDSEVVWGSWRRTESDSGEVGASLSYMKDGALMAEGIEEYYAGIAEELMPFGFEWEVYGSEHNYAVGEVVSYKGYIIMISSVDPDLDTGKIALKGVGGRGE